MENSYELLIGQLQRKAQDMGGWLKFIGVTFIVVGIPSVIELIGFLYIWLGWLLL